MEVYIGKINAGLSVHILSRFKFIFLNTVSMIGYAFTRNRKAFIHYFCAAWI